MANDLQAHAAQARGAIVVDVPGNPPITPRERERLLARILSRCERLGRVCLLWQDACTKSGGRPIISFRSRCRYVRALMYELQNGCAPPPGKVLVAGCGDARCVSHHCAEAITVLALRRRDAARGAYNSAAANAARRVVGSRNARIPDEVVRQVRAFVGTSAQAAQATGVSLAHTKAIRAGRVRVELSNPWKGLL